MEFDYHKREWSKGSVYVPVLPLILNGFPVGHVLVDTGADITLLPMELHQVLNVDLDREHSILVTGADGTEFRVIPSATKVEFRIEQNGRRRMWKATVFFCSSQPTILLGQYECLSELIVILDGKRRKVIVK